jgi:hypothetical protein
MKEIKRIGIMSMAKIYGLSMAILGFVIGIFVGFIMFFLGTYVGSDGPFSRFLGPGLGIVGFIFMPVLYGILGLLFGGFSALIYNLLASWVGGIEIELEEKEEIKKL